MGKTSQATPDGERGLQNRLPPLETYLTAGRVRGISWTALRRQVLELLWRDGRPWGAYNLADELRKTGGTIYPNSLYRILGLLEAAGLIVTIASNRRVQILPDPEQRDWAVLQCSGCDSSRLIPFTTPAGIVRAAATRHGHATDQLVIECLGRCGSCAPPGRGAGGLPLRSASSSSVAFAGQPSATSTSGPGGGDQL
jgi:Fur family zinc uptake transcriptional regulator